MSERIDVHLDEKRCRLYGICVSVLPEVFETPPGNSAAVLLRSSVGENEREDLEEAVRYCPAQAISMQAVSGA